MTLGWPVRVFVPHPTLEAFVPRLVAFFEAYSAFATQDLGGESPGAEETPPLPPAASRGRSRPAAGFSLAAERRHDVVILDVMLPRLNALDVCRKYRPRVDLESNSPRLGRYRPGSAVLAKVLSHGRA